MSRSNTRRLALLILAAGILGLSAATPVSGTSPQQEQSTARQMEQARRIEQAQAQRVQRLKDRLLVDLQHTGEVLGQLAKDQEAFAKQRDALLTSDEGKALAHEPDSFMACRELLRSPSVTAEEIKAKQATAASVLAGLKAEAQQVDVGLVPVPETLQEATELSVWARDRAMRLEGEKAVLNTMLAHAGKLDDPAKAPTLKQALDQYQARWYQTLVDSKILGEQAAEKESRQIVVEASRLAKLEQAQAERDKILDQTRAEIKQMQLAYEVQVLQIKKDVERKEFEAQRAYLDAQAEIDRLRKDADAERTNKAADDELRRSKILNDAKRREQIALLNSPETRMLLVPFTAKGTWLPGTGHTSYQPEPMSLKRLTDFGALHQSDDGLARLLIVATDMHDRERPRWIFGKTLRALHPADRAKVVMAQQRLILLGHLMVEEGLLAP